MNTNIVSDRIISLASNMTSQTTFTSCMHDQMLESNRDDVKLEAMRCVTVMTAKGKLSVPRTLFPHIVKNVSSKNAELKKLIYLYLTNFADQEPDLALLPVATLQKSLKSPNPLVRSSALKVLTSMRLNILSAILMATLRNSVNDLSPYVRKTVAHSIIKIYRLDPSLRSDLIEYIERLFNDKNSMVLSSAVATFEVVCPEKLELVHKQYRRFCFILADCNEWGQTLLLNLLVRYVLKTYSLAKSGELTDYTPSEHDPKILLRSAKPLVHSNNSAVVMAVIKLYIAIANFNEVRSTITKPLIRLLHTQREIQLTVLKIIEEMTDLNKDVTTDEHNEEESEDDDEGVNDNENNKLETIVKENAVEKADSKYDNQPQRNSYQDENTELRQSTVQPVMKDGYIALENENDERAYCPIGGENFCHTSSDLADELKNSSTENNNDLSHQYGENKGQDDNDERDEDEDQEEDDDDDDDDEEDEDEDSSEEDGNDDNEDDDDDEDDGDDDDTDDADEKVVEAVNGRNEKVSNTKNDFDIHSVDLEANKDSGAYREVFRPYIKSFFIKHTDCTQIRLAKLRILTNLSSSVNVNLVLRELQAYIATYVNDREFISAAIHAMGRCAIIVKEVAHTCLNGLTNLLSNNNEHIVSEAIVVLRSQIINKNPNKPICEDMGNGGVEKKEQSTDEKDCEPVSERNKDNELIYCEDDKIVSTVIKQVTKLLPTVTAPHARATILWILAEFCDKNRTAAKCAPNVLRSIAKTFCQEDNFVKLQSLTLASKFLLSLDKDKKAELQEKVQLLTSYLFSLAKYDTNHDVRDRGRFLKKLLDDEEVCLKVLNGIKHHQAA